MQRSLGSLAVTPTRPVAVWLSGLQHQHQESCRLKGVTRPQAWVLSPSVAFAASGSKGWVAVRGRVALPRGSQNCR